MNLENKANKNCVATATIAFKLVSVMFFFNMQFLNPFVGCMNRQVFFHYFLHPIYINDDSLNNKNTSLYSAIQFQQPHKL